MVELVVFGMFLLAFVIYCLSDGFTVGTGILCAWAQSDQEKRFLLRSVAPFWGVNTTWVVISVTLLFAGFPRAFGTLFPLLYFPIMFLVLGYILRGLGIELRTHTDQYPLFFDVIISLGSTLIAGTWGWILCSWAWGFPSVFPHQNLPHVAIYPFFTALLGIGVCALQGSTFLSIKHRSKWVGPLPLAHWVLYCGVITVIFNLMTLSHLFHTSTEIPLACMLLSLALNLITIQLSRNFHMKGAFFASWGVMIPLLLAFVSAVYPNIIPVADPLTSVYISQSASSHSLWISFSIGVAFMFLAIFYLTYLYRHMLSKNMLSREKNNQVK